MFVGVLALCGIFNALISRHSPESDASFVQIRLCSLQPRIREMRFIIWRPVAELERSLIVERVQAGSKWLPTTADRALARVYDCSGTTASTSASHRRISRKFT